MNINASKKNLDVGCPSLGVECLHSKVGWLSPLMAASKMLRWSKSACACCLVCFLVRCASVPLPLWGHQSLLLHLAGDPGEADTAESQLLGKNWTNNTFVGPHLMKLSSSATNWRLRQVDLDSQLLIPKEEGFVCVECQTPIHSQSPGLYSSNRVSFPPYTCHTDPGLCHPWTVDAY